MTKGDKSDTSAAPAPLRKSGRTRVAKTNFSPEQDSQGGRKKNVKEKQCEKKMKPVKSPDDKDHEDSGKENDEDTSLNPIENKDTNKNSADDIASNKTGKKSVNKSDLTPKLSSKLMSTKAAADNDFITPDKPVIKKPSTQSSQKSTQKSSAASKEKGTSRKKSNTESTLVDYETDDAALTPKTAKKTPAKKSKSKNEKEETRDLNEEERKKIEEIARKRVMAPGELFQFVVKKYQEFLMVVLWLKWNALENTVMVRDQNLLEAQKLAKEYSEFGYLYNSILLVLGIGRQDENGQWYVTVGFRVYDGNTRLYGMRLNPVQEKMPCNVIWIHEDISEEDMAVVEEELFVLARQKNYANEKHRKTDLVDELNSFMNIIELDKKRVELASRPGARSYESYWTSARSLNWKRLAQNMIGSTETSIKVAFRIWKQLKPNNLLLLRKLHETKDLGLENFSEAKLTAKFFLNGSEEVQRRCIEEVANYPDTTITSEEKADELCSSLTVIEFIQHGVEQEKFTLEEVTDTVKEKALAVYREKFKKTENWATQETWMIETVQDLIRIEQQEAEKEAKAAEESADNEEKEIESPSIEHIPDNGSDSSAEFGGHNGAEFGGDNGAEDDQENEDSATTVSGKAKKEEMVNEEDNQDENGYYNKMPVTNWASRMMFLRWCLMQLINPELISRDLINDLLSNEHMTFDTIIFEPPAGFSKNISEICHAISNSMVNEQILIVLTADVLKYSTSVAALDQTDILLLSNLTFSGPNNERDKKADKLKPVENTFYCSIFCKKPYLPKYAPTAFKKDWVHSHFTLKKFHGNQMATINKQPCQTNQPPFEIYTILNRLFVKNRTNLLSICSGVGGALIAGLKCGLSTVCLEDNLVWRTNIVNYALETVEPDANFYRYFEPFFAAFNPSNPQFFENAFLPYFSADQWKDICSKGFSALQPMLTEPISRLPPKLRHPTWDFYKLVKSSSKPVPDASAFSPPPPVEDNASAPLDSPTMSSPSNPTAANPLNPSEEAGSSSKKRRLNSSQEQSNDNFLLSGKRGRTAASINNSSTAVYPSSDSDMTKDDPPPVSRNTSKKSVLNTFSSDFTNLLPTKNKTRQANPSMSKEESRQLEKSRKQAAMYYLDLEAKSVPDSDVEEDDLDLGTERNNQFKNGGHQMAEYDDSDDGAMFSPAESENEREKNYLHNYNNNYNNKNSQHTSTPGNLPVRPAYESPLPTKKIAENFMKESEPTAHNTTTPSRKKPAASFVQRYSKAPELSEQEMINSSPLPNTLRSGADDMDSSPSPTQRVHHPESSQSSSQKKAGNKIPAYLQSSPSHSMVSITKSAQVPPQRGGRFYTPPSDKTARIPSQNKSV